MGDNVMLSEFFGKKNIVLYFYPKDETTGCTKEACTFRDSYEEFTNLGAEVIGVSGQSVESHKSFASHYNLPFILLSDEDNKVRQLYGVPSTMGIIPGQSHLHHRQKRHCPPHFQFANSSPETRRRSKENPDGNTQRRKRQLKTERNKLVLNIYNTLTQKIEPFTLQTTKKVKMYTCGPSTYQPPTLATTALSFSKTSSNAIWNI